MKRSSRRIQQRNQKIPKIDEEEIPPKSEFEVKAEPIDDDYDFALNPTPSQQFPEPKQEPIDEDEYQEQPTPCSSTKQPSKPIKSWGRNIKSLDDLLMNDWTTGQDKDLELGESILFNKQPTKEKKPEGLNLFDNEYKEPKIEEDDDDWTASVKEELDDDPETTQKDNLIWRPQLSSLDELLMDEVEHTEHKDTDLRLGDSILFDEDKFKLPVREREFLEPRGPYRQIGRWSLRRELRQKYEIEAHPTIQNMIDICQEFSVSYRTVFEELEAMRVKNNEKCEPGDTCERVRSYNMRENEDWPRMRELDRNIRKILEDDIEAHIKSRKRFTLGYVHLLVEKTDLPPAFIRYQYGAWRGRLMYKQTHSIENWKRESSNDLTVSSVKILEEAYLEKKYKSTSAEREWTKEDLQALAEKVNLTVQRIQIWIQKRNDASHGKLEDDAVSIPVMARRCYISPIQKGVMNEVFSQNGNQIPKGDALVELEQRVHLKAGTIKTYYNQRMRTIKQEARFKSAKKEMSKMKPDKVRQITEYAQLIRRNEEENRQFAQKVGISYESLLGFLEWKKSLTFRRKPQ